MKISDVPVPAVYKEESADFRFFMKWFELALSKVQYDTEEFFDLFDPLRCPEDLLWMLGDTMGYVYDDRMTPAFNRLVMLYFMSMIRLKGSKDGVTLAAQVNLDQFNLEQQAANKSILNNRLDDTSIPSNAVYVQPHVAEGYIDLVYFSDKVPVDTCTEYTRPIGMYLVPHAGVRYDGKTKLSIDSRLTNTNDLNVSIGSTHVGHYNLNDYSRMQRLELSDLDGSTVKDTEGLRREQRYSATREHLSDTREPVWYRNSKYENEPSDIINPGYRALYSLQLVNGNAANSLLSRSTMNLSSIQSTDVSVFDTDGNTYTEEDFISMRAHNNLEYVPPKVMGQLGDSMDIVSADETIDFDS